MIEVWRPKPWYTDAVKIAEFISERDAIRYAIQASRNKQGTAVMEGRRLLCKFYDERFEPTTEPCALCHCTVELLIHEEVKI